MANDVIKNLKDLELKKHELQENISRGIDNPVSNVTSFLSTVINKQKRKEKFNLYDADGMQRNELLDEGVKAVLTLAASVAVTRLKLGTIPKMILTSAVSLATPYIVDKIQKKLRK